jgi:thiamine pyrophosphate-dependent acetolactate synthase large subunit-like protein
MATNEEPTMKFYSAMAKALVDNGVRTMFGVLGDANLYMVDSFVRDYGGNFISAANESGATMMALGHAAISGNVGLVTVTHGPALVNTLTGLVEAAKGSIPIVLLCGDTPVEDREHLQSVSQRDFIVASGAGFEQLRTPQTLSQDLAIALRRAIVERRPIALNIPSEFQWHDVVYQPFRHQVPDARAIVPSSADLDNAVGIIAAAKRPIILAGRGAITPDAKKSLLRLAARTEGLLATTLKAKGLFDGETYDLGLFGTLSSSRTTDLIVASDCIIAFGASLNKFTTAHGSLLRGKRVVQVSLEQGEVGKNVQPDAGVVGDPALVADAILHWLDEIEAPGSGYRTWVQETSNRAKFDQSAFLSDRSSAIDFRIALSRIDAMLPKNRVVVTDGGRFVGEAWKSISVPDPQSFLSTLNFGAIGLGLPASIGAATAAGERPVLLLIGDGGFMLGGLNEFNTAVRHNSDLVVVVCNDGSYGAEHIQFRSKNMDPSLSLFDWPNFAAVANALGGIGTTVESLSDFDAAEHVLRTRDRPVLIDLKLDPDCMLPLPM